MPRKKIEKKSEIIEKLEYIGLDLDNIPDNIQNVKPLKFKVPKFYNEKQYRQYRFVPIKDIQILLSPTNRLDELEEKYKKAGLLKDYLDSKNEENIVKYTTFLNMLKEVKIQDIEKIEREQNKLSKKLPFKVKFEGNYLWQIYYAEETNQYFMLVPTEDSDYSTFFYLLKKQLENKKTGKIFVPIRNLQYSKKYLKKSEFEDIENGLWLFTKDWPLVYEVLDKQENLSIEIVGETNVYEKIKSPYRISLKSALEAGKFHKLLKAMFILQTELPHYFEFRTNISKQGELEFYFGEVKIVYEDMAEFIKEAYEVGEEKKEDTQNKIGQAKIRLQNLKQIAAMQEIEYLEKEKQISTFLECKKTFFGKFKYFFKYSKKNKKNKIREEEKFEENQEKEENKNSKKSQNIRKRNKEIYTIEELIQNYKELEEIENLLKNTIMDINAMKLKNKNMAKKIENASVFIEEIDSHKKSIFEFWKFSNKDEVAVLPEGEEEEVNVIKKIEKVFDYQDDFEEFGIKLDKIQRKILSKEQTDGIYITTTNSLDILNKIKTGNVLPKDIENSLKQMKQEQKQTKNLIGDADIFGGMIQETTQLKKINNKTHREFAKDKFNILEISQKTKAIGYKLVLEQVLENIKKAMEKCKIPEEIPVYKAMVGEKLNLNDFNLFNVNSEKEIKNVISSDNENKINLYKINLKEGTKAVGLTNIIFFDNQNKTLPVGMDLSTQILVDTTKIDITLKNKTSFKIAVLEDSEDDFSKVIIKNVTVFEYGT